MATSPIHKTWQEVVNAIQAWIDVMPDVADLPPVFHVLIAFEDTDTGAALRYYPLRMAQGPGLPMEVLYADSLMGEIALYQPIVVGADAPPLSHQKIIDYLENALYVRIHLAQSLTAQDPKTAGSHLAMANILYALLEKIGMGWFDATEDQGEEGSA